jgi:IcmF-related N-terminal domain
VEACTQRLQYLCRLIARERRPFCPINGILLAFPIAATGSDDFATQAGLVAQRDLATIRRTLQVTCPVFALFCDMEALPGFHTLNDRLAMNLRDRRMGQRLPLVPDAEPSAIPAMLESGVQHIGNRLIPNMVSALWQTEATGGGSYAEAVRSNSELFRLLGSVRDRQARIARVLTRTVISEGAPPAMLGGCYLAGTGPDPVRDQAFIPGVFRRLIEGQDFVAWTPAALAEERKYRFWTRVGYIAMGLLTAACAVVAGYTLFLNRA